MENEVPSRWIQPCNKGRQGQTQVRGQAGSQCNDYGWFFVEHDGFEDSTYQEEIIVAVLHFFVEWLSLSKIQQIIYQHHGYGPADSTILDWVRSYPKILKRFERKRIPKPKVNGRVHLGETRRRWEKNVLVCINYKRGGQQNQV